MFAQIRPSLVILAMLTLLTGLVYPLAVTGVARAALSDQAAGSIVTAHSVDVGSSLIGQAFDDPKYFWSRPSATSPAYNASASSGSNLGPSNPAFLDAVKGRVGVLQAADPGNSALVPVDLVTSSGSGLDPEISPAAARYQIRRIARVRGLTEEHLNVLVAAHTKRPTLGIFGDARVNVLELNLDLDGTGPR